MSSHDSSIVVSRTRRKDYRFESGSRADDDDDRCRHSCALERSNARTNELRPTSLAREEDDVARDDAMRDAIERLRGRAKGFDAIDARDATDDDDDATRGAHAHGD
jgi:hypothetical protein|tara:strand:+ start:1224 stop:1541 length:318 start_codon:yes stop_codon:yes gene_type:complete